MKFGFIYKVFDIETNKCYIGSTLNINQRINHHKYSCNVTCKEIIDKNNYDFEILDTIKFMYPRTLKILESWYIKNNDCVNNRLPLASLSYKQQQQKDWHKKNVEHTKQYRKDYLAKNKEKIKKRKAEKITCECGAEVTRNSMYQHKKSQKHLQAK